MSTNAKQVEGLCNGNVIVEEAIITAAGDFDFVCGSERYMTDATLEILKNNGGSPDYGDASIALKHSPSGEAFDDILDDLGAPVVLDSTTTDTVLEIAAGAPPQQVIRLSVTVGGSNQPDLKARLTYRSI